MRFSAVLCSARRCGSTHIALRTNYVQQSMNFLLWTSYYELPAVDRHWLLGALIDKRPYQQRSIANFEIEILKNKFTALGKLAPNFWLKSSPRHGKWFLFYFTASIAISRSFKLTSDNGQGAPNAMDTPSAPNALDIHQIHIWCSHTMQPNCHVREFTIAPQWP